MAEAALFCAAGATIGEGPVWHEGALIWTDPVEHQLLRFDDAGLTRIPVPHAIWSLEILPDGTLCGALDDRLCVVERDGTLHPGPPATLPLGCRLNDLTADHAGGIWVGMMHCGALATTGMLLRSMSPTAPPIPVAGGLGVPNGLATSSDARTLFVVDTLARTLLSYPVAGDELGQPVILSDFQDVAGKPDGMALDGNGRFHVAMWGGACVAHLAPDGATLGTSPVPAPHVSSVCCAEPGALLVTTSRMRLAPAALDRFPGSGGVFHIPLDETRHD